MPSSIKYRHKQLLIQLKDIEETKADTSIEENKLNHLSKQLEQSASKHDNEIEELKTRIASLQTKLATAEREKQVAILWHRNHIEKIQSEIEIKKNPKKSIKYKQLALKIEEIREEMLSARKNTDESLQPFEEEYYREGCSAALNLSLKEYQDNKYRLQEEERERLAELAEQARQERASRPKQQKQVKKATNKTIQAPLSEEETRAICKDVLNDIINEIISSTANKNT